MKVKFVPQNIECEIKPGQSVLHVAHDNGVHIKSVCKGVPSCTECIVRVVDGAFNTLPPPPKEVMLIGNSYFVDGRRLSCQLKCFGDIVVDLTGQIEKEKQVVKKPRGGKGIAKDPLEHPEDEIRIKEKESMAKLGSLVLEENFENFEDVVAKPVVKNTRPNPSHETRPQQGRNQGNRGGQNRGRNQQQGQRGGQQAQVQAQGQVQNSQQGQRPQQGSNQNQSQGPNNRNNNRGRNRR